MYRPLVATAAPLILEIWNQYIHMSLSSIEYIYFISKYQLIYLSGGEGNMNEVMTAVYKPKYIKYSYGKAPMA